MPESNHTLTEKEKLDSLAEEYWQLQLKKEPMLATETGVHIHDHVIPSYSHESRETFFAETRKLIKSVDAINTSNMNYEDSITHEALRLFLEIDLEGEDFFEEQWTLNPLLNPIGALTEMHEKQPLYPQENLDKLISRYNQVPRMCKELEDRLLEGVANANTASKTGTEKVIKLFRHLLQVPLKNSAYIPQHKPADIDESSFNEIVSRLSVVVDEVVNPAIKKHADWLETVYLQHTHAIPGLIANKNGEKYYNHLIRVCTGERHSANEIHQIGKDEVARIHKEMEDIAEKYIKSRDIRAFTAWLQAQPEQYAKSREDLLAHNRALIERATKKLPDFFGVLPTRVCEVRAVDAFREADSPSGYYCMGPEHGAWPSYYYVNTYRHESRPLYNMEALAFHEAVPGHHLQIALAQELSDIPAFRRYLGPIAFKEGWALYSERLSDEMGLYSDDFTRFGMLNYQAWRAVRLVVDTGLHALSWTREQAIECFYNNTAHTTHEAAVEVDRYTSMPGQALSYMTGRMVFDELRLKAENKLQDQFNLSSFHDCVLSHAALPFPVLRHIVDKWISDTLNSK